MKTTATALMEVQITALAEENQRLRDMLLAASPYLQFIATMSDNQKTEERYRLKARDLLFKIHDSKFTTPKGKKP